MSAVESSREKAAAARALPTSVSFSVFFLLSLVGCLAGALVLNLAGNGTKLFPSPGFPPSTCMRAWKARRLDKLAKSATPPQTLVMGSSRVIPLEQRDVEALSHEPAFNLGVSVGCPVDALAQLRLAVSLGLRPKRIILGVDELAFGDNPEADFYDMQLVTDAALFRQLALRDRIPIVLQILKTISVSSTRTSAQNLWRRWRRNDAGAGDAEPPESELETMHLEEGDTLTAAERRARLTAGVDRLVAYWSKYLDRPDKVDGMRPTRRKLQMLDEFLALAAQQGIQVTVVLLPAHPEFERRVFTSRIRAIRDQLSVTLTERCERYGCRYRDYTDLNAFGGDPNEFADGTHMTPTNGRRMLAALLSGATGPSGVAPASGARR